jgi:mannose-6-phosphate isomerase-like protein (cupin superfamily)
MFNLPGSCQSPYYTCQCPYYVNTPMYNTGSIYNANRMYQCPYLSGMPVYNPNMAEQLPNQYISYTDQAKTGAPIKLTDYGPEPFAVNITEAAKQNNTFRTALWTGKHLQVTLMSINVGEDIGLEIHPNLDQFIRIEEGQGLVKMGNRKDALDFQANVRDDFAFIIPAGTWHNLINTGNRPLKLYSIYAPPQHPHGTVHQTKAIAQAAEKDNGH